MKILVTGGTGFIGRHVVDDILTRHPGAALSVLTRDPDRPLPWGGKVRAVGGDVTEPECLPNATRGYDCIVHCVQFPHHPVENRWRGWTYERVDGQGTVNVVDAARQNGVKRFIYLSGAGTSPEKTQSWFRAKRTAEAAVRESGVPFVIFRPSWIYGPGDRSLNLFADFMRGYPPLPRWVREHDLALPLMPFVPVIGDGKAKVQPISVFDVAKVVSMALTKEEATGRTIELGGPETLTMDDILLTLKRTLGSWRPLVHHPIPLMKAAAFALQAACHVPAVFTLGGIAPAPLLNPAAIDFITMEVSVDPRPAEELFGVRFERLEDGLRRYMKA